MNQLSYDHNGRAVIFCKGVYWFNGTHRPKIGYGIFFEDNHVWNIGGPANGRATRQNAEIQAVLEAATIAKYKDLRKVKIYTDSQFVIDCIKKWIPIWRRNRWKNERGETIIDRDELIEMMDVLDDVDYEIEHVNSHHSLHGYIEAKKLAAEGAAQYRF